MNRFRPALESLDDRSLPSLFWFAGLFAGGWETLADAKDAVDDDQSRIQLELE